MKETTSMMMMMMMMMMIIIIIIIILSAPFPHNVEVSAFLQAMFTPKEPILLNIAPQI
jgi:hypothetical protein